LVEQVASKSNARVQVFREFPGQKLLHNLVKNHPAERTGAGHFKTLGVTLQRYRLFKRIANSIGVMLARSSPNDRWRAFVDEALFRNKNVS